MARIVEAAKKVATWVGAALLIVGAAILAFLKLRPGLGSSGSVSGSGVPDASTATTAAVTTAEAQAARAKEAASGTASAAVEELKSAAKSDDAAKRRKNVAQMMRKS